MPERHRHAPVSRIGKAVVPHLDPEIVDVVFRDAPGSRQNELLQNIPASEAHIIRAAQVRAEELREQHADPGDAFIEGVTRALEAGRRDEQLRADVAQLPPAA